VRTLEETLKPHEVDRPWLLDVTGMGLIVLLGAILLPSWNLAGQSYLTQGPGQLTSVYLLMALGMLLALRVGVVDLGAWAVAGMGGVLAATLIGRGASPGEAFLAGVAGGAAVGLLCGLAVSAGLPSPVVTLAAGAVVVWLIVPALVPTGIQAGGAVPVRPETFHAWKHKLDALIGGPGQGDGMPLLLILRMLLVAGAYAAVLLVLFILNAAGRHVVLPAGRVRVVAALTASGALAGLAGAAWLIEHSRAPVPRGLVGDLRPLAAAVLAGGLLYGGRGRTLLACIWLPPALLVSAMWWLRTHYLHAWGIELQALVLAAMAAVVHVAARRAVAGVGIARRAKLAAWIAATGLVVFGLSAYAPGPTVRKLLQLSGLLAGGAGAVLLATSVRPPPRGQGSRPQHTGRDLAPDQPSHSAVTRDLPDV
jgi:ribose/xylose/arabinose/galactoside ABC-type transport system permease subunit